VFDPDQREARAAARARKVRALRDRACRPALLSRRLWPRRPRRPVFCRPFGKRGIPPRTKRTFIPRKNLNACNTGWPGGFIHVPRGQEPREGFVRTSFAGGFATNRRCYPSSGGGPVREPPGGTLLAGISFARNEAQRLALETQKETLRNAPRLSGVTIEQQNAFALRFAEDLCEPWTCDYGGRGREAGEFAGTSKGRIQIQRAISLGFRSVPLDHAALAVKLGREPTPGDRAAACRSGEFLIQGRARGPRGGTWQGATDTRGRERTPRQVAGPRLTLLPGAAALPTVGGVAVTGTADPFAGATVYACRYIPGTTTRAFYEGPYIPGMESYWIGAGGAIGTDKASTYAQCPPK